jgi:hypothetical protein
MATALGIIAIVIGGLIGGGGAWPMKLLRTFRFEHWWLVANAISLVIVPWTITLVMFPNAWEAYRDVPLANLIASNLLSLVWGVANILCGLCYVRIGVGLTQAVLTGLGVSVGVTLPMIIKGSGQFEDAPGVASPAGLTVILGVGVMLFGVVSAALAGLGRDRATNKHFQTTGSFAVGLIMAILSGVFSAGIWLAFVYSQGPIVSRVSMVEPATTVDVHVKGNAGLSGSYRVNQDGNMELNGKPIQVAGLSAKAAADKIAGELGLPQRTETEASVRLETGNILAVFPVWAVGLLCGALLNLAYPVYLLSKNKSWGALVADWKDFGLAAIMGLQGCIAISLPAKGMILLGPLGASVGFGIQQAMQMAGGQGVGFLSGEWRGVHGKPRVQIYLAIAALIAASMVMAYANRLSKS